MTDRLPLKKVPRARFGFFAVSVLALAGGLWLYRQRSHEPQVSSSSEAPSVPVVPPEATVEPSVPTIDAPLSVANPNLLDLVVLPDSKTVVAVGTEGTILRSLDDGRTYHSVTSNTREYLSKVLVEHASSALLVIGSGGTLLRSEDGGAHFAPVSLGSAATLSAIAQSSATGNIVIVGDDGVASVSTDQGRTFRRETTGTSVLLTELVALQGPRGHFIAGGDQGTLLLREIGGAWRRLTAADDKFVMALAALPNGAALVGLQDGRILRSGDEGETWAGVHRETVDHYVTGFDLATDRQFVIARVRQEPLLISRDLGRSFTKSDYAPAPGISPFVWQAGSGFLGLESTGGLARSDTDARTWKTSPTRLPARARIVVTNPNTQTILAAGSSGFLGRSTDRGKTLEIVQPDLGSLIRAIAWDPNTATVVAVGLDETLVRSTDGGKTYERRRINLKPKAELSAIAFESRSGSFVAATTLGQILMSTDAGKTFTERSTIGEKPVLSLLAVHTESILALCEEIGAQVSLDGGVSWQPAQSPIQTTLRHALAFGSSKVLVAVGDHGTTLRSTDWGRSFTQIHSGTEVSLRFASYESKTKRLWVVGDRGLLLLSNDEGTTFHRVPVPTEENLFTVGATDDGATLYVGGNGGTLLRSDDHGASFTSVATGSKQPVRVTELDPSTGEFIIAGVGGLLMRTTNQKTPRRFEGNFGGRFDRTLYHAPSRTMLVTGDRLLRLAAP